MSNEITVTSRLRCVNGNLTEDRNPGQLSFDQAALGAHGPTHVIGTSEEDIASGDIATLGWLYMRNLDPANYVTWGPKTGGGDLLPIGRLKAGETALLRLEPGVTLRMQANTAPCKVQFLFLDN